MTIYETAAAGTPVRVGIISGTLALHAGTLTLFNAAPTGRQLFKIALDPGQEFSEIGDVFTTPGEYELEPIGEDN